MKKHICAFRQPGDDSHFGRRLLTVSYAAKFCLLIVYYVFVIIQIKLLTGYSCLIASSAGISTAFDAG